MTEQVQYSDEEIKLQIKRGMTGRDGRGNSVNVWLRLERAKTMIAYNMMQLTSELNGNLERLAIYGRGLSDILDENIVEMKRYCCENFEQAVSEGEIKEDDLSPTVYYIAGVFMNLYLYHCPFCGTDLREREDIRWRIR